MNGIGKQFMEMTKYANMHEAPRRTGGKQPPVELPLEQCVAPIALPDPAEAQYSRDTLLDIINRRRSLRGYGEEAISLTELSFLLWCCQGVQEKADKYTMRTVPSAGARHAFETFVLANNVEGLQHGLYRFSALNTALVPTDLSDGIAEKLKEGCLNQGMVSACAAAFFWTAELERMAFRYGERGYRYLHLDAGHACQNLYLAAEAIGCGACAIGAFDDDEVNEILALDGENRFIVYAAVVGKKP